MRLNPMGMFPQNWAFRTALPNIGRLQCAYCHEASYVKWALLDSNQSLLRREDGGNGATISQISDCAFDIPKQTLQFKWILYRWQNSAIGESELIFVLPRGRAAVRRA